ncbi:integrase [Desulfovibrio aminophilus]|uniref:integrase n=1 Tax=Desulfovibrio aminophilus TaxID=81425 RepID=UPI0004866C3A|nr:site-specific integrase [Desulfovibrio aminophilus]
MASISRQTSGRWQAKVRKVGFPLRSKTFATKADAEAWARAQEREMDRGAFLPTDAAERTSVAAILDRYILEVFPRLAGEGKNFHANMARMKAEIGGISLSALDPSHISAYRDKALTLVSAQTVRHDLGLLSRALKMAVIDWGIALPRGLPTALVRLPKVPRSRDRRLKSGEEAKLLRAAEAYGGEIGDVISFALETAARRTEIASMRWEHVDLKSRVVTFPETKNGEIRRAPLSPRALEILKARKRDLGPVWRMRPDSISQAFERVCAKAELEDLRFHDLRHEAVSRLFEKGLNTMEVAAISGHKTLAMLKKYTHLRAEDLAAKL